jgi:chorismate mutase
MTKTSTKDLISFLRSGGHRDTRPDKEITELKAQIVLLEARLAAAAPAGPSPVNQSLLDAMEERHKLSKQVQEEKHKYSKMVHEVRIFKTEADEESRRLSLQLEAAYVELEQIQTSLKEVVKLSGLALTSSTTAFAKVDVIRDHKCKHATSLFESYEETSHSSHRLSTSSFEHSGSDRRSSSGSGL